MILTGAVAMGLLPLALPLASAYPAMTVLWLALGLAGVAGDDARRAIAETLSAAGRPTGGFRRAVHPQPRGLADRISPGGMVGQRGRPAARLRNAGYCWHRIDRIRLAHLASVPRPRASRYCPLDHPHLQGHRAHRHPIVVDELHPKLVGPGLRVLPPEIKRAGRRATGAQLPILHPKTF